MGIYVQLKVISHFSFYLCYLALIIKGSVTVDGLCRVIHTITEDVQSQLKGTRLHPGGFQLLYS
jgi:hypothetical protein